MAEWLQRRQMLHRICRVDNQTNGTQINLNEITITGKMETILGIQVT